MQLLWGGFQRCQSEEGRVVSLRLAGAPNDVIRLMGRWAESSFVFERYQVISSRELSAYASRISALSADELVADGKGAILWGGLRYQWYLPRGPGSGLY